MKRAAYCITNMSKDGPHWWYPKRRKWANDLRGPCSTHRWISDARLAWREFRKLPDGFCMSKHFYRNGKRYAIDWEKRGSKCVPV